MDPDARREREERKRKAQQAMLDAGVERLREEKRRRQREDFEQDVRLLDALHESAPMLPDTSVYHILAQVLGRERAAAVGEFKQHMHGLRTEAEARSIRGGSPSRYAGGGGGGR